jgi:hypothetical protein
MLWTSCVSSWPRRTTAEESTLSEDDAKIEALLNRYRPVGPPLELRARVLQVAVPPRMRRTTAAGWAIAASLILSVGLNLAADRLTQDTAQLVGIGQIEWTSRNEGYVSSLVGEGAGRDYVALALLADTCRSKGIPLQISLARIPGVAP